MCQLASSQTETKSASAEKRPNQATIKGLKAPYFFYRNFSDLPDPDPSKPITAPGRIPNFPAKMMAILSRPDLQGIISWMPHGRGWKVHKPREFEVKVIPTYFEHSKFSSFIRQANGWGFRRMIGKGPDRNSYYHELFLRGCPHLIKLMKRPTNTTRPQADATTEPDFYRISDEHPLPEADFDTDTLLNNKLQEQVGQDSRNSYCSYHDDGRYAHSHQHARMTPLPVHSSFLQPQKHLQDVFEPFQMNQYSAYQARQHHYEPVQAMAAPSPPHQGPFIARALSHVESHPRPAQPVPVQSHAPSVVARAVSPVQSHIEAYTPGPLPIFVPGNEWTETCLEPREMPRDFEDPFSGGLRPVDFW